MDIQQLEQTAKALVVTGKGILAADESTGSVGKRLAALGLENTEENRRDMREMIFKTPGLSEYISGVILFDETFRQSGSDGVLFVEDMKVNGVIPGIKVDEGLENINDVEQVTKGLENLSSRLPEYYELGARFAKWRAVIAITDEYPSEELIKEASLRLAKYAKICQENNIVPIVEPEVLIDGEHSSHTATRMAEVIERVHKAVFEALATEGVHLPGIILKPSMVVAGKTCPTQASHEEVARETLRVLKDTVPDEVPGIAFLSGGQEDLDATIHLDLINKMAKEQGGAPWPLTYSYLRALQGAARKVWAGNPENVNAAQAVALHRAKMNSLASKGEYSSDMEQSASAA